MATSNSGRHDRSRPPESADGTDSVGSASAYPFTFPQGRRAFPGESTLSAIDEEQRNLLNSALAIFEETADGFTEVQWGGLFLLRQAQQVGLHLANALPRAGSLPAAAAGNLQQGPATAAGPSAPVGVKVVLGDGETLVTKALLHEEYRRVRALISGAAAIARATTSWTDVRNDPLVRLLDEADNDLECDIWSMIDATCGVALAADDKAGHE